MLDKIANRNQILRPAAELVVELLNLHNGRSVAAVLRVERCQSIRRFPEIWMGYHQIIHPAEGANILIFNPAAKNRHLCLVGRKNHVRPRRILTNNKLQNGTHTHKRSLNITPSAVPNFPNHRTCCGLLHRIAHHLSRIGRRPHPNRLLVLYQRNIRLRANPVQMGNGSTDARTVQGHRKRRYPRNTRLVRPPQRNASRHISTRYRGNRIRLSRR